MKPVEKELTVKKTLSFALVGMLSLALAAPVSAGRGHGGGFHGGSRGGVPHCGAPHGGFHRGGFPPFASSFAPLFLARVLPAAGPAHPDHSFSPPDPPGRPGPGVVP